MINAITEVNDGTMSIREASTLYQIPRSTLQRRLKSNNVTKTLGRYQSIFSPQQETEILQHVIYLENRFFGATTRDVRAMAFELAEKNNINHPFDRNKGLAGRDWLAGFRQRHPEIRLRTPEATSIARAQGFNRPVVAKYFEILVTVQRQYQFQPARIFNVDETGITTVIKYYNEWYYEVAFVNIFLYLKGSIKII